MKNQELFGVYSQFERFVTGYVVAIIRLLPEGYPSVENRLLRVIRGQTFPLAPEAFARHLEKNSEQDSPREKVVGAMSELLHLVLETIEYLGTEVGRDLAHRPLLFMSQYGEADEQAFSLLTLARLNHSAGREQLPRQLAEWSRTVRWALLSLLEREGDWQWMGMFLSCLEDGEPEIVRVAVSAVGKSGTVSAAPRLLELLHGSGEMVTISAALALGRLREPAALLPLMELGTTTRSQRVRASVVSALGDFGEPRVVPFLARHLEHRDSRVRANALTALRRVFQSLGRVEETIIQKMMVCLEDAEHRVRADAIFNLWELGRIESLDCIERMLKDDRHEARASGAWLCGRLKLLQIKDSLQLLLRDPEWNVRKTAAVALIAFGDSGRQLLLSLARTGTMEEQISSAFALGLEHDPEGIDRLFFTSRNGEELSQGATDLLLRFSRPLS